MATNVIVIDSSARRATIKTTPATYLSDVLADACTKLGANPAQYGLKHNNRAVDLSRTIRLSGLTSGAKLELVQLSKSAGVVNVALQLPESESQGSTSRLTDKFPSSTTLWLLLRKFEAGVAGSSVARNLTARGIPSAGADGGRLYYEQPILTAMGRELSSFTDLQKTLAQLGFNTGNVLIKLSFKSTETPLETAMAQIKQYFDEPSLNSTQADNMSSDTPQSPSQDNAGNQASLPKAETEMEALKSQVQPEWTEDEQTQQMSIDTESGAMVTGESASGETPTVSDRPVSVYRPPTRSSATATSHNEADYVPTIEHAQAHQKHLQQESRNRRLPTDAEILAKQKEQREELGKIESVEIKVRFPDQSAVSGKFGQEDTSATLYNFVRQCLTEGLRSEPFVLRDLAVRDRTGGILSETSKRLIIDLQLKGRVLLTFSWHDNASPSTKTIKDVLKEGLKQQARDFIAPTMPQTTDKDDSGIKVDLGPKQETPESGGAKSKVPKWLKGLGKK